MAINLQKISKEIKLDLSNVPKSERTTVKREVGEFVVDEILRAVSTGTSPVSNRGKFKKLNKDYAKAEKGGDTNPDLDLLGDMLDSLTFKNTKEGIEVGIFRAKEVPKADGHNNFSGKSILPTRRFIPDSFETFKQGINRGVKDIVKEFTIDPLEKRAEIVGDLLTIEETAKGVAIADLFTDEGLEEYLKSEGYI